MKHICTLLLILSTAVCGAQELKNELAVSAVGNLNSVSYIFLSQRVFTADGALSQDGRPTTSSQKSSVGWGMEYRRWLSPHYALGAIFEQNTSDGKLLPAGYPVGNEYLYYYWPQMHYESGVLLTERFPAGVRFTPFLHEGAGGNITDGYDNSGWSHDFAFITGFGVDYALSARTALRVGMNILNTRTGCYGDHTCRQTWSNVQDLKLGVVYRW